jgi:hypothetical protein
VQHSRTRAPLATVQVHTRSHAQRSHCDSPSPGGDVARRSPGGDVEYWSTHGCASLHFQPPGFESNTSPSPIGLEMLMMLILIEAVDPVGAKEVAKVGVVDGVCDGTAVGLQKQITRLPGNASDHTSAPTKANTQTHTNRETCTENRARARADASKHACARARPRACVHKTLAKHAYAFTQASSARAEYANTREEVRVQERPGNHAPREQRAQTRT